MLRESKGACFSTSAVCYKPPWVRLDSWVLPLQKKAGSMLTSAAILFSLRAQFCDFISSCIKYYTWPMLSSSRLIRKMLENRGLILKLMQALICKVNKLTERSNLICHVLIKYDFIWIVSPHLSGDFYTWWAFRNFPWQTRRSRATVQ